MEKVYLRNKMKQRLAEMNEADYWQQSKKIREKLFNSTEWSEAKTIGITISTGREVDTLAIIEEAWQTNKRVVVPKCYPQKRELKFYQINSFTEVEDSFYSLKEPIISITKLVQKEDIDLVVVPGIIYDQRGYRIGYGGGYYDRFLSDYPNKTISLAFEMQIVEEVPAEEHDIAVEKLISNT
ncbi:5-formyltetrahydrofolate cyclo-ligase [Anaerobacillus sp. CMMVII]|uniref:5-formyltetrahydrofolate cyclo-ligase n=1 Tax=Anaerobacillus sp. CMMVII TaxID=2755588 RepID=UPI0021B828EB|nr:5-formyltetrahydrofolate cyclo-ligase [Anaerobacillus sp. CMMVII]MCT8139730.1 5-formyltetrahydrofolate cyclo-ligase [Anaerobacillus sp. CMMVII]